MEPVTWSVTTPSGEVTRTGGEKLPYYSPIKITKDMDDAQKTFFTKYNTMIKTLVDNNLMEPK